MYFELLMVLFHLYVTAEAYNGHLCSIIVIILCDVLTPVFACADHPKYLEFESRAIISYMLDLFYSISSGFCIYAMQRSIFSTTITA